MENSVSTKKTTTIKHEVTVSGKDILKALGIKESASIAFDVPSGGDYSGMSIDITIEDPVNISWSETTIEY